MKRYVKIEKLVEEILALRQEMIEFDRKRNYNREALGALRRGEVQSNSKLWMTFATGSQPGESIMVKMPRKNLVSMLEGEQVRLTELTDKNRADCKAKVRDLMQCMGGKEEMSRLMGGDMDPYVLQLLM